MNATDREDPRVIANNHELICGPTGSGKTHTVKQRLEDDEAMCWIIDTSDGQSLPEWADKADWFADNDKAIRELLAALEDEIGLRSERLAELGVRDFYAEEDRHGLPPVVLTIDDARGLFRDPAHVAVVKRSIPKAGRCGIKFRVVVGRPDLGAFGGSELIRATVAQNVTHMDGAATR